MKKIILSLFASSIIGKPIIIGHRGASAYEPENTLRSFERAIAMGASMIELDVFVCASGEVVVIHDDTVDRTTNGKGRVKELTLDTLRTLDAGKGEHIPLLSEVFDLVHSRIPINIELKDPAAARPVAELIGRFIKNKKASYNDVIVTSFDTKALQDFHSYYPQVKTGVIFDDDKRNVADYIKTTKNVAAHYIIVDFTTITPELVQRAHKNGLTVFAYTVNSKNDAKKTVALNIDGIITDYPDILHN